MNYRIDSIAALARQMTFTPHEALTVQLSAAEDLLFSLDPAKAYPYDFVLFRITGYRPKKVDSALLTGVALQHDLGVMIEALSETLDLVVSQISQPVLTIDDVCQRFNVTSKTIQRWRRKGLPARRFTFPDGKRRVGFLLQSVERFLAGHHEQVDRGANFSQVNDAERDDILRRARRLATQCQCCTGEITRRIARKLGRSPLTILHTIRKFDQANPEGAIFPGAVEPIREQDRAAIATSYYESGVGIKTLARRYCRTRSAIYRVVLEERIERIQNRKVKFIDDPLYHQPHAASQIDQMLAAEEIAPAPVVEDGRIPKDLPPYLRELYRTPLLSSSKERAIFLKLHLHRYHFIAARRKLEPQFARSRDVNVMESHLRKATEVKNAIVRANLRLVVSIAKKHLRPNLSLMELVSEGNITLMRAVDSFDIHRGNRFSTYATLALMKGFARSIPMLRGTGSPAGTARTLLGQVEMTDLPDRRPDTDLDRLGKRDEVHVLMSRLSQQEREVVSARFGLAGDEAATFEEVSTRLGLSKQRVRQIEQNAIEKLRTRPSAN